MKKKLLLYSMTLIIAGIILISVLFSFLIRNYYYNEVEKKMKAEILFIDHDLQRINTSGLSKTQFQLLLKQYAEIMDQDEDSSDISRVTLINISGEVFCDSLIDWTATENHITRPEIAQVLNGSAYGINERKSASTSVQYLYMAKKIVLAQSDTAIIVRAAVPLSQLAPMRRAIFYIIAISLLVILILTLLLTNILGKKLTAPINHLINATLQISLGNYEKRCNIRSKDELGVLSISFNEMADTLEENFNALTKINSELDSIMENAGEGIVAVDKEFNIIHINRTAIELFALSEEADFIGTAFTGIVRVNRLYELIEAAKSTKDYVSCDMPYYANGENQIYQVSVNPARSKLDFGYVILIRNCTELRKLEQIRTEFVSNVTHELRTPLTSIRGYIETLRAGAIEDKNVSEKFLQIVDIEAERLFMLISDILQLSEIEGLNADTNVAPFDLSELIESVCALLKPNSDKSNIIMHRETRDTITMTANQNRIKQLLINLIDNAIKYTSENGSVTITASKEPGYIKIIVKDTGIGIHKEDLERIFERFYRVDKGRSRAVGGTGLGLSIVKHIVNLYNGDISVNSTLGSGTSFIARFPQ